MLEHAVRTEDLPRHAVVAARAGAPAGGEQPVDAAEGIEVRQDIAEEFAQVFGRRVDAAARALHAHLDALRESVRSDRNKCGEG